MCLGTATAAASSDDVAAKLTAGLAENWATGMSNVLLLASLKVGGIAISNAVLSNRSRQER
jgi:hypothetical protein